MKKHKVEIPEGYEVDMISPLKLYGNEGDKGLQITIGFKPIKKELPKTWEEYALSNQTEIWLLAVNVPEKHIALGKLEILRDVYNEGQEVRLPVTIHRTSNGSVALFTHDTSPIRLNNPEIADKFFVAFKDLLEIAKPLL